MDYQANLTQFILTVFKKSVQTTEVQNLSILRHLLTFIGKVEIQNVEKCLKKKQKKSNYKRYDTEGTPTMRHFCFL
jgi:hypothetical protein